MALFKFLEKKSCSVCGGEIGLLGNRKLTDGNLCKQCAGKLSPWFTDRRASTVEEIRQQLEYREENRGEVREFHVTRTLGGGHTRLLLDEDAGKFIVTSARDLENANPDVIRFSQITGCETEVTERRDEEKQTVKDAEGHTKRISYTPPHVNYEYDFYVEIRVDSPYFDEIRFQVNPSSVELRPWEGGLVSLNGVTRSMQLQDNEYMKYEEMTREIKAALDEAREKARRPQTAPATVICPHCGAPTTPSSGGCCEYCGAPLNV